MKKLFLTLLVCIASVCAYANTCTYDGVQVSLFSETPVCRNGQVIINISTDRKNISNVRCQIELIGGRREWVDIEVNDGYGQLDIAYFIINSGMELRENVGYHVELVERTGQCY